MKKFILIILIFTTSQLFSQRYFASKAPGFLGKKFYITGGIGNSPYMLFYSPNNERYEGSFKNSISFYGGVNYTLGKKIDVGIKSSYSSISLINLLKSVSYLQFQPRILSSTQIAPLGNRVGLGLNMDQITLKDSSNASISDLTYSLAIVAERNLPLNNKMLFTYGIEIAIPFKMDNRGSTRTISEETIISNVFKINFGLCYMLF